MQILQPSCERHICTCIFTCTMPLPLNTQFCTLCLTAVKLHQSCPTLCDPIDGSPPGSSVPGSLQARTLKWLAISFSNAWKWNVKVKPFSRVRLLATPWTAAYQAPPSMGFSRQECWNGVPSPSLLCLTRKSLLVWWLGLSQSLFYNFFGYIWF